MSFEEYIVNDLEMQDIHQDVAAIKEVFDQLTYTHIPISKDGVYVGSLSENDVRCFEGNKTLMDCQYAFEGFFSRISDNWLDVLENFAKNNTNIMPILNDEQQYIGYVELSDIISLFNETPFLNEAGGIIVIEKRINDYSFSEVCQIVESNDTKLLGAFISEMQNGNVQITLKVVHATINEVLQTFRRYDYEVISSHQEDTFYKNLQERSQYLEKYLNI